MYLKKSVRGGRGGGYQEKKIKKFYLGSSMSPEEKKSVIILNKFSIYTDFIQY